MSSARSGVRVKKAERRQLRLEQRTLDDALEADHPARLLWCLAEKLDLSPLYDRIKSRDDNPGAPAIDPLITLMLWIYATTEGEASAREIAELCVRHDAYRWICGGVQVKAHHLSDFRAESGPLFCRLITQVVTVAVHQELCDLSRVALDGTRLRASAGAASFRRDVSLQEAKRKAEEHLAAVLEDAQNPSHTLVRRRARERGATDRLARIENALAELEAMGPAAEEAEHRVSTTDPDCRVMKRADAGFRPGFNAQFAVTTGKAQLIVGVEVTPFGTDQSAALPMVEQLADRYGTTPKELLTDGGYVSHDEIDALAEQNVKLVAPLPKRRKGQRPPEEPRKTDSPAVAEWRARMQTDEAKELYKLRGQTVERVNADGKQHRALDDVPVRGVEKAFAFVSLFALSFNLLRLIALATAG